jgi:hypothetical protein
MDRPQPAAPEEPVDHVRRYAGAQQLRAADDTVLGRRHLPDLPLDFGSRHSGSGLQILSARASALKSVRVAPCFEVHG